MDPTHEVSHRPWPLPGGPWIMAQRWQELLFAHWPMSVDSLRALVPLPLEIDVFDGRGWLGIVPFRMSGVHPRLLPPVPPFSAFPELNVRTYVIFDGKPGVYFFSLDAASRVAVWSAHTFCRLPYYHARMRSRRDGECVEYESHRTDSPRPADLLATYGPTGPALEPVPGTIDHWLTERYCLYVVPADRRVLRGDIHHPRWRLQPAEAALARNSMATPLGLTLPGTEPLLHFAAAQDVRIWPLRRAQPTRGTTR